MRTLAMTVASLGCAAMAVGWVLFLAFVLLPTRDQPVAAVLIPVSIVFIRLFSLFALLGAFWSGARSRAWFWIVEAVVAVLVLLLNAPFIPYPLAHPADTSSFVVVMIIVSGGAAILVGGIAAALDVRRGRPTWSRDGRSGVVLVAIVAAAGRIDGDICSRWVGYAGGGQVVAAPTATQSISVAGGAFQQPRLTMSGDDVAWACSSPTSMPPGTRSNRQPRDPRPAAGGLHDGRRRPARTARAGSSSMQRSRPSRRGHGRDDRGGLSPSFGRVLSSLPQRNGYEPLRGGDRGGWWPADHTSLGDAVASVLN